MPYIKEWEQSQLDALTTLKSLARAFAVTSLSFALSLFRSLSLSCSLALALSLSPPLPLPLSLARALSLSLSLEVSSWGGCPPRNSQNLPHSRS